MSDIKLKTFKYFSSIIKKIKYYSDFLNEYYIMIIYNFIKLESKITDIKMLIYGYSLIFQDNILIILKILYYNVILNHIYYLNRYEI